MYVNQPINWCLYYNDKIPIPKLLSLLSQLFEGYVVYRTNLRFCSKNDMDTNTPLPKPIVKQAKNEWR